MTRLLLAAALLGAVGAATVAVNLSESVAYADEPSRDQGSDIIRAAVGACLDAGGAWTQGQQAGVWQGRCDPFNVGTLPVVKRGRR